MATLAEFNNVLTHFGVLGMRWGKRRGRTVGPSSSDSKTASGLRKKTASELSNKEIETVLTRVRLSQSYKQVTATGMDKAKAAVRASFSKSARASVDKATKTATDDATKIIMDEYIAPYIKEIKGKKG